MARLFSVGDKIAGETVSSVEEDGGRVVITVGDQQIKLATGARLIGCKVEMSPGQYEMFEKMVRLWAEKAIA